MTEMTERWGKRRKQLPDDVKGQRGYWMLKEEAMDCTMWGTRFGRGYGNLIRRTTERWKPCKMWKHHKRPL